MEPERALLLVIGTAQGSLGRALDRVDGFLEAWQIERECRAEVMVIVDEIGANILRHAWADDGVHQFALELELGPGLELWLRAVDDGVPFDPTNHAEPSLDAGLDDRLPGGVGLSLVHQMSGSVAYARRDGFNELQVCKPLRATGDG